MNDLKARACQLSRMTQQLDREFDKYDQLEKLDWAKIFELIMQILPLIFAFFQQDYRKPEAN